MGGPRWAKHTRVTALGDTSGAFSCVSENKPRQRGLPGFPPSLACSWRSGGPHLAGPALPAPAVPGCQSFFSKWGTIPLSSGLGLPGPSVSFRPSSASWDKYFCGGKTGTTSGRCRDSGFNAVAELENAWAPSWVLWLLGSKEQCKRALD